MKVGLTSGTFDLFHVGHLEFLERCREKCDFLIVGVRETKDCRKRLPVFTQYNRLRIIKSLKCVDEALLFSGTALELFSKFPCDIFFTSEEWRGSKEWLEIPEDVAFYLKPSMEHTSDIIRRIREEDYERN